MFDFDQVRLKALLETCTYVVFNYTRRGLFDRDKLIVLSLLTTQIMLKVIINSTFPNIPGNTYCACWKIMFLDLFIM